MNKQFTLYKWGPPLYRTFIEKTAIDYIIHNRNNYSIPANETLAGIISDEKVIDDLGRDFLKPIIFNEIRTYLFILNNRNNNSSDIDAKNRIEKLDLSLLGLWVNTQKAKEYNPTHDHSGDISFVFYPKIDEDIYKEKSYDNGQNLNGSITFYYGYDTQTGYDQSKHKCIDYINTLPVSTLNFAPTTGEMFIFPSYLKHSVKAFQSEGKERISVSGNIKINYRE